MEPVAGILLAAGRSSRMPGLSKLLRPLNGVTVIDAVADCASQSGLEPVVAVVGPEGGAVAKRCEARGLRVVRNPEARRGRVTSLRAGVRALAPPPAAVVVLLGDEPNLDPEVVRLLIERWREGEGPLLRVRYEDRPGHPVLLDRSLFARLESLPDGDAVWESLTRETAGREIPVAAPAPVDVDRPEDLRRARERSPG